MLAIVIGLCGNTGGEPEGTPIFKDTGGLESELISVIELYVLWRKFMTIKVMSGKVMSGVPN